MRMRKIMGMGTSAMAAALLSMPVASTQAATTPIQPPAGGEASHAEIFSGIYGGTFVANGLNFTNGTITAVRVDDAADQIFTMSNFSASAKAVFAGYNQSFGYLPGDDGGSFTKLFDVAGNEFGVTGDVGSTTITGPFRFARNGSQGVLASSDPADNSGLDYLVTYQIEGLATQLPVLALFWEDRPPQTTDWDYNDLVVEVRGIDVAPTPAAFGVGLMLLGGMMMRRRRNVAVPA